MQQKQNLIKEEASNVLENIKLEAKNIMIIITLCIVLNVETIDNLFKSQVMFLTESGSLNLQAVFVKALLIGIFYYLIKTYLLK